MGFVQCAITRLTMTTPLYLIMESIRWPQSATLASVGPQAGLASAMTDGAKVLQEDILH